MNEFSRTEMLIGTDSLIELRNTAIAVFGVGGVGSHCIEALARCGIGKLILVDDDTVALTNINRQSIAYHSTIGQYKTHLMKARIADINPVAEVLTFETFLMPDNLEWLFLQIGTVDYIIDAIDTVSAKIAIAEYACRRQVPLIACMGTGNKLHPELFEIADINNTSVCPLCKVMRKELKVKGIPGLKVLYSKEVPLKPQIPTSENSNKRAIPGSIAFVPPVAGLMIAGEVIRDLIGMNI